MVNVRLVGSEAGSYHALAVDSQVIKNRARLWLRSERAMGLDGVPAAPKPADAASEEASGTAAVPAAKAAPAVSLPGQAVLPPPAPLPEAPLSREQKMALLAQMEEQEVRNCVRCGLSRGRKHTVFGEGDPDAQLMFIGEGPGDTEDRTGRPFVGRAGQLLDKMILGMGLRREQVFIANIVKCRAFLPGPPPKDRPPAPEEVQACSPYLVRQIQIIRPRVIVTLGLPATQFILQTRLSMGAMRGRWADYRGIKVMPTYHPSYVLRYYTPDTRKAVWSDLRQVMDELGLKPPPKAAAD